MSGKDVCPDRILLMFSMLSSADIPLAYFMFGISRKTSFAIANNACFSFPVKSTSFTLSSRWFRAVFEPLGGQTVTVGKSRSATGWVVIVVTMGEACQAMYDLLMSCPAHKNPVQTITNQANFAGLL